MDMALLCPVCQLSDYRPNAALIVGAEDAVHDDCAVQETGRSWCRYTFSVTVVPAWPRIDQTGDVGRGTFLYLAGVHAMGTIGVTQYLEEHLDELYRELKNRRFSLLVVLRVRPGQPGGDGVEALTSVPQ